ncbi:hypothetical protein [Hymenobacter elongatus]|uniref:DUF4848 domain-containing protein n=1 Tax=Hymenobacter elongatus TaxID=877208 RepID=A0A4Z0PPV4_9BACT|nr:hypothetical protein [Hymenobacter elongatus]TGE19648.1 hypothetical protein E5J99_02500 [Hymenobacter elongatus]
MKNLTPFALAISAAGFFTACQKDNSIEPSHTATVQQADARQASGGYSVRNGRLVFANQAAFQKVVEHLNANKTSLAAWDNGNGVTSLKEKYAAIDKRLAALDAKFEQLSAAEQALAQQEMTVSERVEKGAILWVPDPVFASILNAEGEFQIGDEVHHLTQRDEYIVNASEQAVLKRQDWKNPAVRTFSIQYGTNKKTEGTAQRSGQFTMWYTDYTERDINGNTLPKTYNGRPTRLWASQWNVVWAAYASHGVRSQYEYKSRFAGWLDNDCSEIYVKGESVIIRPNDDSRTEQYVTNEDIKYNDDVVEATLQSHASVEFMEIVWSNSTHRAVYKGATAQLSL